MIVSLSLRTMWTKSRILLIVAVLAGGMLLSLRWAVAAPTADYTVTKTDDTNDGACDVSDCSLREAIIAANNNPGAETIALPAGTYVLTRTGTGEDLASTGDLDIRDDLTIDGDDPNTTIIDADNIDRVFH